MKQAHIYFQDTLAGTLVEDENGYEFRYHSDYLTSPEAETISLTLPLKAEPYKSKVLFPFFDGLIPEGWILDLAQKNWKFQLRDRMAILLATCQDCIGAVSVKPIEQES